MIFQIRLCGILRLLIYINIHAETTALTFKGIRNSLYLAFMRSYGMERQIYVIPNPMFQFGNSFMVLIVLKTDNFRNQEKYRYQSKIRIT